MSADFNANAFQQPAPPHVAADGQGRANLLARMMGGPPLAVLARLVFVSLVVGALLMWLNIRPYEVFWAIQRMIDRLWLYGWDSLRQIADYIAAGAVLVVPVWLVLRIFNARGAR